MNPLKDSVKNTKIFLLGLSRQELEQFANQLGQPTYRGRQLYDWLYRKRERDFERMTDLPVEFRQALRMNAEALPLQEVKRSESRDGTVKLLIKTADGYKIEAVAIPEGTRLTACLSSQVGCALDCRFCATARLGFKRNLSAGEIIAQLIMLEHALNRHFTNVVMMGMGEPLLNCDAVFKTACLITDPDGFGLSRNHFTISTVGWLKGIFALTEAVLSQKMPKVKLSISLNALTEEKRRILMPKASRFPINDIIAAARKYAKVSGLPVTLNYLLLSGLNDSLSEAEKLAHWANQYRMKVNLIEYNNIGEAFNRTSPVKREAFIKCMKDAGVVVTARTSRGVDIAAACGQLAGEGL